MYLDYVVQNYSLDIVSDLWCHRIHHPFVLFHLQRYYKSEAEARSMVEKGKSWAVLVVPHNFSDSLRSRLDNGKDVPEWDLITSTIDVYQDKSSKFVVLRVAYLIKLVQQ